MHPRHKPQECEGEAKETKGKGHTETKKEEKPKAKVTFNEAPMALNDSEEE